MSHKQLNIDAGSPPVATAKGQSRIRLLRPPQVDTLHSIDVQEINAPERLLENQEAGCHDSF